MHRFLGTRQNAIVLIVVVGILAVLSLLAATFGIIMSVELASSQAQTEYELARQAAHAGYEFLLKALNDYDATVGLTAGPPPSFCPDPHDQFGCFELPGPANLRVVFQLHPPEVDPPQHTSLLRRDWVSGLGLEKSGQFALNGMGRMGEYVDPAVTNAEVQRTSFHASLARLIYSRLGDADVAAEMAAYYTSGTGWDNDERARVASYIATAIIVHRYGGDGLPGRRGFDNHAYTHLSPSVYWPGLWSTNDAGVAPPSHFWGTAASGGTNWLQQVVVDFGTVDADPVPGEDNVLIDSTKTWIPNEYAGMICAITANAGVDEWRVIRSNTATKLFMYEDWPTVPTDKRPDTGADPADPSDNSIYVILSRETFWRLTRWNGADVWLAPDPLNDSMIGFTAAASGKGVGWRSIGASGFYFLTTLAAPNWPATGVPTYRDAFSINTVGTFCGLTDDIPTAMVWPNGALACETYVFPRAVNVGTIVEASASAIRIGRQLGGGEDYANGAHVIRILDGTGTGQVRMIDSLAGNTAEGAVFNLTDSWDVDPVATTVYDAGNVDSGTGTTLTVDPARWRPHEHAGRVVRLNDGQVGLITENTRNEITVGGAFSPFPVNTNTFQIVGQTYAIEYDCFDYGSVSGSTADTLSDTKSWEADAYNGAVVHVYYDAPANAAAIGQVRLIADTADLDPGTLTLASRWAVQPSTSALYRIELPQDYKYRPGDLTGNDRIYHSVAEILPVITSALEYDPYETGWGSDEIGDVAGIVYNAIRDYLTVSNRTVSRQGGSVSINDWANDGLDNDDDGVIDEVNEAPATSAELARALYEGLGMGEWVHSGAASDIPSRALWCAELAASIIDFRDADHVPTPVTAADIGEDGMFADTVYGAEGVRITEVMATPAEIDPLPNDLKPPGSSTADYVGLELRNDGYTGQTDGTLGGGWTYDNTNPVADPFPPYYVELKQAAMALPNPGWDWDNGAWLLKEAGIWGKWQFGAFADIDGDTDVDADDNVHGLKEGWYAIRLKGTPGATLRFDLDNAAPVEGEADLDGTTGWGYVRRLAADGTQRGLLAVQVDAAPKLTFYLSSNTVDDKFETFQLLPQFVEITNCAAQDVALQSIDTGVAGSGAIELPRDATIRGAAADGNFPVKYGTYIVAMCEQAYDKQYGVTVAPATEPSGIWGDTAEEDYPVYFAGDVSDTLADAMLIAESSPVISVKAEGDIIASTGTTGYDGDVGMCADYHAREKSLSPFRRTWLDYDDPATTATLAASQNAGPTGVAGQPRTCLNRRYEYIWLGEAATGHPTFISAGNLTLAQRVFPVILNRPYPTPGWLGLVPDPPEGDAYAWRTIGPIVPDATDSYAVGATHELLGAMISHAQVGGVHARISLTNPSYTVRLEGLRTVLPDAALEIAWQKTGTAETSGASTLTDADAPWDVDESASGGPPADNPVDYILTIEDGTGKGQWRVIESVDVLGTGTILTLDHPWDVVPDATSRYRISVGSSWDALLCCPKMQDIPAAGIGTNLDDDSGAGLYADDHVDDVDELEEWARRYSNLLDLQNANLKYVVGGFVYERAAKPGDAPIAQVRIEVELDVSGSQLHVVQFRYVTE